MPIAYCDNCHEYADCCLCYGADPNESAHKSCSRCNAGMPSFRVDELCEECRAEDDHEYGDRFGSCDNCGTDLTGNDGGDQCQFAVAAVAVDPDADDDGDFDSDLDDDLDDDDGPARDPSKEPTDTIPVTDPPGGEGGG